MGIPHHQYVHWTSDQTETLRRLWGDGLSTKAIGDKMGISKNAVVGKAHRLNLPGRPSPLNRPGPRKPPKVKRAGKVTLDQLTPIQPYTKPGRLAAKMGPAVPERVESLFDRTLPINGATPIDRSILGAAISLGIAGAVEQRALDRATPSRLATFKPRPRSNACCWPMWGDNERPTQQFCDAPTAGGAYCEHHHAVGYRKVDANYPPSVGWL